MYHAPIAKPIITGSSLHAFEWSCLVKMSAGFKEEGSLHLTKKRKLHDLISKVGLIKAQSGRFGQSALPKQAVAAASRLQLITSGKYSAGAMQQPSLPCRQCQASIVKVTTSQALATTLLKSAYMTSISFAKSFQQFAA